MRLWSSAGRRAMVVIRLVLTAAAVAGGQPASAADPLEGLWRSAHMEEGDTRRALLEAERAAALHGSARWFEVEALLADVALADRNLELAAERARAVVADPEVTRIAPRAAVRAHLVLAAVERQAARYPQGLEFVERAIGVADGGSVPPWLAAESRIHRAVLAQEMQQLDVALQGFAEAEALLGPSAPQEPFLLAQILGGRGTVFAQRGQLAESLPVLTRSVELFEASASETNPLRLTAYFNVATVALGVGQLALAADLVARQQALCARVPVPAPCDLGRMYNMAGGVHLRSGRLAEAEAALRKALVHRAGLGANHPEFLELLVNLGTVTLEAGRPREAIDLLTAGLRGLTSILPAHHARVVQSRTNLAVALAAVGRHGEAVSEYQEAIAAIEAAGGGAAAAPTRASLGAELLAAGDPAEALEVLRVALEALRAGRGPYARPTLLARQNEARALLATGQVDAAVAAIDTLLQDTASSLGATAPLTAGMQAVRAEALLAARRPAEALVAAKDGVAAAAAGIQAGYAEAVAARGTSAGLGLEAAWALSAGDPQARSALLADVYGLLQVGIRGATGAQWAQAVLRRDPALPADAIGRLAADREAARQARRAADTALQATLVRATAPGAGAGKPDLSGLIDAVVQAERRLGDADAKLRAADPRLGLLVEIEPVSLDATRQRLGRGEALLVALPTARAVHLMLVTADGVHWHRAPIAETDLCARVAELRFALDPTRPLQCPAARRSGTDATPGDAQAPLGNAAARRSRSFDRAAAFALHRDLFGTFADALAGVERLVVVADGPLAQLPLATLVTRPPTGSDDDPAALRGTHWLVRDHALSLAPSPAAFVRMRALGGRPVPAGGVAGFGAPCFAGVDAAGACAVPAGDADGLSSLLPLPSAVREIQALEARLAGKSRVLIGADATESRWQGETFADAGVIALATHGLVAGEAGALEPALALTPTGEADGYLTASEIARGPDLGGRLVVLSGCNTAGPDGAPGADALTGLVRAFFAAGATSVLASQIPVRDDLAPRLTVDAAAAPQGQRALALRRAMLDIIDDPALGEAPHPRLWAGFAIHGGD